MLKTRRTRITAVLGGVLCTLAIGTGIAVASSEDNWAAGANKAWAASSPKTTFTSSTLTVTCTTNTAGGSSVGAGPDRGTLSMNPPKFSHCTDNSMQSDTVTTAKSGWKLAFVSDKGNAKCPAGTGKDETKGKDCALISVPKDAAVIKVGGELPCTITVQPSGPAVVGATVKDPGGTTKDTFTLNSQSLSYSGTGTGCSAISGTATFTGTYTLSAPNKGVLVDKS